ncbi:hypothetical protein TMatcc_004911 [Talaromyces marneffei ATCC 18224]
MACRFNKINPSFAWLEPNRVHGSEAESHRVYLGFAGLVLLTPYFWLILLRSDGVFRLKPLRTALNYVPNEVASDVAVELAVYMISDDRAVLKAYWYQVLSPARSVVVVPVVRGIPVPTWSAIQDFAQSTDDIIFLILFLLSRIKETIDIGDYRLFLLRVRGTRETKLGYPPGFLGWVFAGASLSFPRFNLITPRNLLSTPFSCLVYLVVDRSLSVRFTALNVILDCIC